MQTILVLNTKGGSGKTTVATNIASLYATRGKTTALMDYDPQGSSLQWQRLRPVKLPGIHTVDASSKKTGITRSFQIKLPGDTDKVVIDAPAGANGMMLQEILQRCNILLIPVAPSPIDIHATADFIRDLLLASKIRNRIHKGQLYIGVIANRVRSKRPLYEPLKKFLKNLDIPFITQLTDSDVYLHAAEQGIGIHEMDYEDALEERREWRPLISWLDTPSHEVSAPPEPHEYDSGELGKMPSYSRSA